MLFVCQYEFVDKGNLRVKKIDEDFNFSRRQLEPWSILPAQSLSWSKSSY